MGGVVTGITDAVGLTDSEAPQRAAKKAARTQAEAQQNALNYMREREEVPQQFREGAIQSLGGLYGIQGGNEQAFQQAQQSPIYQATMGQQDQMEEAILRNQSATGALRTGATDQMLAENQRNLQLQALQNTAGGIQSLAGLRGYTPQIANQMAGIGETRAQGITAAAQSQQQSNQQGFGNLMGLGSLGLSAYSAGLFCDPALKTNIEHVGEVGGFNIYRWDWNDKAAELGLYGEGVGPMADEIETYEPERVVIRQGYKYVKGDDE